MSELAPILLALGSAVLFAISAQFQNLGLRHADSRTGALITISTSAVVYWCASPFLLESAYWLSPAVLIFVVIGLFRPFLTANLALAGIRRLGPTLASTLASTTPVFAAVFGIVLLGETLTWPLALGTAAIMAGVMTLTMGRRVTSARPVWALALPVGAAALRSLAHALSKIGLESIPSPYFAGLVGFSVSATVAIAAHNSRRPRQPIPWRAPGLGWFVAAGTIIGMSILSLNTALHLGQIVVVVPIVASSPLFTLLLSVLLFRKEVLTGRIFLAVALVVPAVVLIAAQS